MRDKAFGALLLLEFLCTAFLGKIEDSSLYVWKGSQRFSLHTGLGFFQKCWQCNAVQDEWESNHLRGFVAWLLPFTGAKWIPVIWINSVVMISPKTSSLGLFRDTNNLLINSDWLPLCHTTRCSTSSGSATPLSINSRYYHGFSYNPLPWLIVCQVRCKFHPPLSPACSLYVSGAPGMCAANTGLQKCPARVWRIQRQNCVLLLLFSHSLPPKLVHDENC